jgi:superfamily I DNA and RNA helicase
VQFLASLPSYGQDQSAKNIWSKLEVLLNGVDGICYYKHPVIVSTTKSAPDLTLLARGFQPLAIKICNFSLEDLRDIGDLTWTTTDGVIDSPVLELDDYIVGLQHKFLKERPLRHTFEATGVLAFPLIARTDFERQFVLNGDTRVLWADLDLQSALVPTEALSDRQWLLAKSVFQGVSPINQSTSDITTAKASTLGEAIRILEKEIALLDEEQHKVAIQIAPGPQRIRGLAGTGKTVVLAMKAANLHLRYPDNNILFTFHTQSLYNQAKALITKFYRVHSVDDPDWDRLHVRHGWGSNRRPGVYSEVCRRAGEVPMALPAARASDRALPFRACCKAALQMNVKPLYDYILVDEAQDFPREFFQLLYKLAKDDKRICWAYDELQSLSSIDVPSPTELFGTDNQGKPLISLEGDDYEGGIEKDFVLHRSYRCPQDVLMLAHGIGLGIHSFRGPVQMLGNKTSWTSIGYEVIEGDMIKDQQTVIYRPPQNSPNRLRDIYTGSRNVVEVKTFDDRLSEFDWVASQIKNDIENEDMRPEQIVVISLVSTVAKQNLTSIQQRLFKDEISSTIPGLVDDTAEFAETGMVTLSTVYRAKGNEAAIVYIVNFDGLYDYTEEIERRNQAFASISRSKAWVRITGVGKAMTAAQAEIQKILTEIPYFKFTFPDIAHLRKLDASETSRRRRDVRTAQESIRKLIGIDEEALHALPPELLEQLKNKINGMRDED